MKSSVSITILNVSLLIIWWGVSGCVALYVEKELPAPIHKPISVSLVAEEGLQVSEEDLVRFQNSIKTRLAEELFHIQQNSTIRVVGTVTSFRWCSVTGGGQRHDTDNSTEIDTSWVVQGGESPSQASARIELWEFCPGLEEAGRKVAECLIQFLAKRD